MASSACSLGLDAQKSSEGSKREKEKSEMLRQFLVAFLKHRFDFSDWNSKCDDRNTRIYQPFVTQVLESIAVPKTR